MKSPFASERRTVHEAPTASTTTDAMTQAKSLHNIQDLLNQVRYHLIGLRMSGVEAIYDDRPKAQSTPEDGPQSVEPVKIAAARLAEIRKQLGECRRCRLHEHRTHIVFGDGSPDPPLVFVGEGPGADEDRQGQPFVGKAGKLLDKMIHSLGLKRQQVYICNVVKCRPPRNRTPQPDEIATCSPFLMQQLEALQPSIICTLGACATQTLLNTKNAISRLRGKVHHWRGIPVVATYHPAYLLRNPGQKRAVWQDLLLVRNYL